jgi:hypothetical protein
MSQFASLFKTDAQEKKATKSKPQPTKKKAATSPPPAQPPLQKTTVAKSEKRAGGKSSNSDFTQVLTYIKKDTHNRVKAELIFDDEKRDLSDLVEELLAGWLKNKK